MKAISLWQPWATLVATGAKQCETRHWPTSYRGQNIRPLEITYGMNNCSKAGKQKRATELMISNY